METNENKETFDIDDPNFKILTEEEILAMPGEEQTRYLKDLLKSFLDKEFQTRSKFKKQLANYQKAIKNLYQSILRFKARKENDLFKKLLVISEEGINDLKTAKEEIEKHIQNCNDMLENTNENYFEIAGEKIQMDETEDVESESIEEIYKEALEEVNREIEEGNFTEVPNQKEINALIDSLPKKEANYILENFGYYTQNKENDSNQSISQPNKLTEAELQLLSIEDQTRYAIENKKKSKMKFEKLVKNLSKGMEEINRNMQYIYQSLDFYENILSYISSNQVDKVRELYISHSKMVEEQKGNIESFYDLVVRSQKDELTPELEEAIQKMAKEIETYVPEIEDKTEHEEEETEINFNEVFSRNFEEIKNITDKFKKQSD
jgi:hypothetical protein